MLCHARYWHSRIGLPNVNCAAGYSVCHRRGDPLHEIMTVQDHEPFCISLDVTSNFRKRGVRSALPALEFGSTASHKCGRHVGWLQAPSGLIRKYDTIAIVESISNPSGLTHAVMSTRLLRLIPYFPIGSSCQLFGFRKSNKCPSVSKVEVKGAPSVNFVAVDSWFIWIVPDCLCLSGSFHRTQHGLFLSCRSVSAGPLLLTPRLPKASYLPK
jgi:hypothetical protein